MNYSLIISLLGIAGSLTAVLITVSSARKENVRKERREGADQNALAETDATKHTMDTLTGNVALLQTTCDGLNVKYDEERKRRRDLEDEVGENRREIKTLRHELDALNFKYETEKKSLQEIITQHQADEVNLHNRVTDLTCENERLRQEITDLRACLEIREPPKSGSDKKL